GRSVALARGFRMEADSLEALTPGQRIRQVTAIGSAEGQSWDTLQVAGPAPADTAGPDTVGGLALGDQDLIFADTIVGWFRADSAGADSARTDSAAVPADTTRPAPVRRDTAQGDSASAELERMLAWGNARSLYRLAPSREDRERDPNAKRGINYVIADTIDLAFAEGEVDVANVRGLKRGVYLDPVRADSAGRDTLPRDTGAVAAGPPPGATVDAPANADPPAAPVNPPAQPAPALPVQTQPAQTTTTPARRPAAGGRP
ncbi:MAG TPA: hypothetical protein VF142_24320, partial [Longimicrobium sp.]